jgi:hypothetical protein
VQQGDYLTTKETAGGIEGFALDRISVAFAGQNPPHQGRGPDADCQG